MDLIVDVGNTFVKIAVFEDDNIIFCQKYSEVNASIIFEIKNKFDTKRGIISSVRNNEAEVSAILNKINISFYWLNHKMEFPFKINYKTPETLGLDRVSAVVGAMAMFPNSNLLIVDMGTCITSDFVDENLVYHGGSIAPGFEMRFKALHHFTQKLPQIKYENQLIKLIGDSTDNSILSGVYNGFKYEILGMISAYEQQYNDLKIVLTGGDYKLFDLEAKNRIFADDFLVLRGLQQILILNEKN
ncbi:MAG: pantothenate kinase [Flavobacteriales bacterium]|nr:type III pantothenate kinase [Flavobacteriales bacterium]MBQ21268.1 pantothenate kinase [Flavobacteriales bacterium]|tara:strand:+ start:52087 stop:52818 length:732 start_codon:yes stop_codon:yes gene_type:complete